jgi:hypothetical protein
MRPATQRVQEAIPSFHLKIALVFLFLPHCNLASCEVPDSRLLFLAAPACLPIDGATLRHMCSR